MQVYCAGTIGIGTNDRININKAISESNFPRRLKGVTSLSGGGCLIPIIKIIKAKSIQVGNQKLSASIRIKVAHEAYFCFPPSNA